MYFRKLLCFIVFAVFLVSCSENVDESADKLVFVRLSAITEKVLSVSDDSDSSNAKFYYTATPNYSGHAMGKTDEPVEIHLNDGCAELGEFSQGSWTFEVFAEDGNKRKIMSGMSTTVLKTGQENIISVNMRQSLGTGTGKLKVCFTVPYTGEGEYTLALSYRKSGSDTYLIEKNWKSEVSQSSVKYSGEMNLDSGIYELNFIYLKDGIQVGGETVASAVFTSGETYINGSIESGLNVKASIIVNLESNGLNSFAGETQTYSELETPLSWGSEDNLATSYEWKLNGNTVNCHTSTYTFCEKEPGTYTVVCVAETESGTQTSVFTVSVKVPNVLDFIFLRCGTLDAGKVCVGYLDSEDNNVEFPILYRGDLDPDNEPSDFGLKMRIVDATVQENLSDVKYIQVNSEWSRTPSSNYYSVVWSYSKQQNNKLKEAVIRATLSSGGLSYCSALETAVFAKGVTKLPTNCMKNDTSLTKVYLSKDVSEVSSTAFSGCSALTTIYIEKGSSLTKASFNVSDSVNVITGYESSLFR